MSGTVPNPGHRHQSAARSVFRVLGPLSMAVALVVGAWAILSDGRGVAGIGRIEGPHCRGCGVRNDADARFCDSCGQSLA